MTDRPIPNLADVSKMCWYNAKINENNIFDVF
jgi:hypothetical protein